MSQTPSNTLNTLRIRKHRDAEPHAHPKVCVGYCFSIGPNTFFQTPSIDQETTKSDMTTTS